MDSIQALGELVDIISRHMNEIRIKEASRCSNIGWETPPDVYDDFEINYTLSGTRLVTFSEGTMAAAPCDVIFLDSSEMSLCAFGTFTFAYFIFRIDDPGGRNKEIYNRMKACFRALRIRKGRLHGDGGAEKHLLDMVDEMMGKHENHEIAVKISALAFLLKLHREAAAEARGENMRRQHKYADLVSDLSAYLSEQLDKEISLEQLGRRYGLNPRYLNRVFKVATGHPIFRSAAPPRGESEEAAQDQLVAGNRYCDGSRARQQPIFQHAIPENNRHDTACVQKSTDMKLKKRDACAQWQGNCGLVKMTSEQSIFISRAHLIP